MYQLAILSNDAETYRSMLQRDKLQHIQVIACGNDESAIARAGDCEIMLATPELAAQALPQCARLRWLQSTWAGNRPLIAVDKRDYLLTGVKDVFGPAMREYVFAYLLYFSRNIAEFERYQQHRQWGAPAFSSLQGKTIGIMGVGSIGKEIARQAKSFGMQVHGLTRSSTDCEWVDKYFNLSERLQFARQLDYLVCLLPDTPETADLIDASFIANMQKRSVIINAGRGQLIDDAALIVALQQGQLKAAVLDVFRQEPLPSEHPFWQCPNLHITHHTAAISQPADIYRLFTSNLERFHNNQPLHHKVDFGQGY